MLVTARQLRVEDLRWIADAMGHWEYTEKWARPWARTPPPQVLGSLVWDGVAMQEAVGESDGNMLALVQVGDVDFQHGLGSLELLISPDSHRKIDGVVRGFVDRTLRELDLRKLMVAGCAQNLRLPPSLEAGAVSVGCLVAHARRPYGRFVDVQLRELRNETW